MRPEDAVAYGLCVGLTARNDRGAAKPTEVIRICRFRVVETADSCGGEAERTTAWAANLPMGKGNFLMGHTETRLMVDTENDAQGAVHGDTACSPPFLWPIVIITITGSLSSSAASLLLTLPRTECAIHYVSWNLFHSCTTTGTSCTVVGPPTTNPSKYCSYSITVVGCVVNYVRGKCIISTVQLRRGTVVNCGQQGTCTLYVR